MNRITKKSYKDNKKSRDKIKEGDRRTGRTGGNKNRIAKIG